MHPGFPGVGITDVLIPGVKVTSYLQPPEDPAGQAAPAVTYSFSQPAPTPYDGAITVTSAGSRSPDLVPMTRPSSGVIPIEVSTELPALIAAAEQPLPR